MSDVSDGAPSWSGGADGRGGGGARETDATHLGVAGADNGADTEQVQRAAGRRRRTAPHQQPSESAGWRRTRDDKHGLRELKWRLADIQHSCNNAGHRATQHEEIIGRGVGLLFRHLYLRSRDVSAADSGYYLSRVVMGRTAVLKHIFSFIPTYNLQFHR